jgi:ADP-ribosylglycohydrolase
MAANLGDDTDTAGAVVGWLAGICYLKSGISREWVAGLARSGDIVLFARRFADVVLKSRH